MPIYGKATFVNGSVNHGEVETGVFKDNSINDGEVTRGTFDDNSTNHGHIIEEGIFNDESVNDGSSEGDVVLNDRAVDSNVVEEPADLASIDLNMDIEELLPSLGSIEEGANNTETGANIGMYPSIYPEAAGGDSYSVPGDYFVPRSDIDPFKIINDDNWEDAIDIAAGISNCTAYGLSAIHIHSDFFVNGSMKRTTEAYDSYYFDNKYTDLSITWNIDNIDDVSKEDIIGIFSLQNMDVNDILEEAWVNSLPLTALNPSNENLEQVFLVSYTNIVSTCKTLLAEMIEWNNVTKNSIWPASEPLKFTGVISEWNFAFSSQEDIDIVSPYLNVNAFKNKDGLNLFQPKWLVKESTQDECGWYMFRKPDMPLPYQTWGSWDSSEKDIIWRAKKNDTTLADNESVWGHEQGFCTPNSGNFYLPQNLPGRYATNYMLNNPAGAMGATTFAQAISDAYNRVKPHVWPLLCKAYNLLHVSGRTFTGRTTIFGLNGDGTKDVKVPGVNAGDNGIGKWLIPGTNKNYRTDNTTQHGVSLNIKNIKMFWGTTDVNLIKLIEPHVVVEANGKRLTVPLVDSGPGLGTKNGIDLTYATVQALFPGTKQKYPTWEAGIVKITPGQKGIDFTPEAVIQYFENKKNATPKPLVKKGSYTSRRTLSNINSVISAATGMGVNEPETDKPTFMSKVSKWLDRTSLDYHIKKNPWNLSQALTLVGFIPHPVTRSVSLVKGVVQVSSKVVNFLINRAKAKKLGITKRDLNLASKKVWIGFINKGLEQIADNDYTRIVENVANTTIRIVTRRKASWGLYQNINWLRKKGILPMDPNPDAGKPKEIKVTGFIGSSY